MTLVKSIQEFYKKQLKGWQLLQNNVTALDKAEYRYFSFGNFEFALQHNPQRITSTIAVVLPEVIKNRKCFLCKKNRPVEQKEFLYKNDFLILANPFPILKEHLTITSINHIEQSIEMNFPFFLEMANDLGERYSIYYNGPRCGASAPDHLHFQAGLKNSLPIENKYDFLKSFFFKKIFEENGGKMYSIEKILRNGLILESNNMNQLIIWFNKLVFALKTFTNETSEPMMNIISTFEGGFWRVIIFLRKTHRPKEYYADGENNILISPAVMDLGGLLIAPRKEDFEKLTDYNIQSIFRQVTLSDSEHQAAVKIFTSTL